MVTIIIVNWNGFSNLKECLESLRKITYRDIELVIVDNGSTDNSVDYIKKQKAVFRKLVLVENDKNLGFAQGNNLGYLPSKGDLLLFLNNDTLVEKDFLEPLIKKITSDPKIGAVQPKILAYPQRNIIDSVGSYLLPTGFLYHLGHKKLDQPRYNFGSEIFTMKGACMLFKRKVLEKVGLFDRDYFAYFEETDLCQRAWLAGYKILYVPESKIYHKGGETAKSLNPSFIQFHSFKNRIFTYLKNFESSYLLKIAIPHLIFCELISTLYLLTLKFSLGLAIQKAIFWNILHFKKILQEREKIAKIRKVSDSDFIPKIIRRVGIDYYYHLFATSLAGYKD